MKELDMEKEDHASSPSMKQSTLSGMAWLTSSTGLQVVMRIAVLAVLARVLTPTDFGLVTTGLLVVGLAEFFTTLGVGPALVQRPELEERHIRTAFYSSLLLGLAGAGVIWGLTPLISRFFEMERLPTVLHALVLLFPLHSLSSVSENLLQRELRFRQLAIVDVFVYLIAYGVLGITLALMGMGIWALVLANLAGAFVKGLALYWVNPHPIKPQLEVRAIKDLFSFGGGFTLAGIFGFFALKGDYIVVGRWLGAGALGLYERAYTLMTTSVSLFGKTLDKVLFPNMSKVQDDLPRLSSVYQRVIASTALILLPVSVIAVILAPEIVHVLLGSQWTEAIMPFRILALGMVFRTSVKISTSLAKAKGAVYGIAWRQGVYAVLVLGGAYIGHFWGLPGVALGVIGALFAQFLMLSHLALSATGVTWKMLWQAHQSALSLTLSLGSIAWGIAWASRSVEVGALFVLGISCMTLLLALYLFLRFYPFFFLGKEGVWLVQTLYSYLPFKMAILESFAGKRWEDRVVSPMDP